MIGEPSIDISIIPPQDLSTRMRDRPGIIATPASKHDDSEQRQEARATHSSDRPAQPTGFGGVGGVPGVVAFVDFPNGRRLIDRGAGIDRKQRLSPLAVRNYRLGNGLQHH